MKKAEMIDKIKKDVGKIIYKIDVSGQRGGEFGTVSDYRLVKKEPNEYYDSFVSQEIVYVNDIGRICLGMNYKLALSIEEIEQTFDKKINYLKKEVESYEYMKNLHINKAKELGFDYQIFEDIKTKNKYGEYYDNYITSQCCNAIVSEEDICCKCEKDVN